MEQDVDGILYGWRLVDTSDEIGKSEADRSHLSVGAQDYSTRAVKRWTIVDRWGVTDPRPERERARSVSARR